MQQTAPKFMAQVKAKFIAPGQSQQDQQRQNQLPPQNRAHRVSSGNFSHSSMQNMQHQQNSGSLSHRQMHIEPIQVNQASSPQGGGESNQTPQQHKISLQKLVNSANANKRELSAGIHHSDNSNALLFSQTPQSTKQQQQHLQHQQNIVHNNIHNKSSNSGTTSSNGAINNNRHQQQAAQPHQNNVAPNTAVNGVVTRGYSQSHQQLQVQQQLSSQQHQYMNAEQMNQFTSNPAPQMVPVTLDAAQQRQYAMSQNQMLLFSHLTPSIPQYPSALENNNNSAQNNVRHSQNNYTSQHSHQSHHLSAQQQHHTSPQYLSQPPTSPVQNHQQQHHLNRPNQVNNYNGGDGTFSQQQFILDNQNNNLKQNNVVGDVSVSESQHLLSPILSPSSDIHQASQHSTRQATMLMGYNTCQQLTSSQNHNNLMIDASNNHNLSNDASSVHQFLSQTPQAELSQTHGALPAFELIEGKQVVGQQVKGGNVKPSFGVSNKQQIQQTSMNGRSLTKKGVAGRHSDNQKSNGQARIGSNGRPLRHPQGAATSTGQQQSISMHRPASLSQGQPPAQSSANLNLMRQLYSAKGGVQTPPANFKGSSSSVGSRRQSGESSGMMSMGSIGTNFNEGITGEMVQKPLVREFKTQGRLNKGNSIMPSSTPSHHDESLHQTKDSHSNNLSRKSNAIVAAASLAKKQSPKGGAAMGNNSSQHVSQMGSTRARVNLKRGQNVGNAQVTREIANSGAKEATCVTPVNFTEKQHSQHIQAKLQGTKKQKSVSESNATIKSSKLKSMVKQQPAPDTIAPPVRFTTSGQKSIFDEPNRGSEELKTSQQYAHPEQPQNDLSPPDLTFKSQTIRMHNSEEQNPDNVDVSHISPNKQSFQQSSNQDAIERNEELMSLLACLNEQAIKELGNQDESEWETGMQRLLKAYKIMVETKNPNSFDANYKAIICYNLACCCQMQSELQDCSKYLSKAIEFVSDKLLSLKEQAVSQFNQSQQLHNTTMEQPSLTITNSSITTTAAKKNSDLFEKAANKNSGSKKGGTTMSAHNRNTQNPSSASKTGAGSGRYGTLTGKQQSQPTGGANSAGQGTRNGGNQMAQRTSTQQRNLKSPLRTHEKVGRGGRAAQGAALGSTQTTNSLFSDFSRLANANQRQKVSQQQLRTISVNAANNQVKPRGVGPSTTKNAQSQQAQQFAKTGTNFMTATGPGTTPSSRAVGKQGNKDVQQMSDLKRKEGRNGYNYSHITAGQPQTVQVNHDNFFSHNKNIRDVAKKKAAKAQIIQVKNWLDCYNNTTQALKSRPPREILERSIHLTRYYCRFVLQLCAVLSQLNEHENALAFSKKASGLASELTEMTLILIRDETKPVKNSLQDTSGFGDASSQKPKRRKHSTSNQLDPYNTSLSKQKTTVSARFNNQNAKNGSQNSSLVQSNLNQISKGGVSQSYTMSNFNQLGAGKDQQSSKLLNNSGLTLSYFPNPEQIKHERESLERIHTFSLKEPMDFNASDDQIGAQTLTGNFLDPLLGSQTDRANRNEGPLSGDSKQNLSMETPFSGTRQRGISEGSRNSSTTSNRSCSQYVPEKVKIFQKQINKTHDIVDELINIQKEFFKISDLNFKERRDFFQDRMAEKKKLKISFQTFEEMNKLQIEQKFKITARSALGVKNYSTDDWIFSFNIGNIMHLQTLGFDELANAKTCQSMNKGADGKTNTTGLLKAGIQGSVTTQQAIRNYLMSEISKDQLLYKALYVIVSYFCIGTELRFLATLSPQKFSLKDSEIWHAKAIHIASYFLPNDCPLIQHITQSYAKHHLRPKIKRRQDQLASLANC